MREIQIGEKKVSIRATTMALVYYKQEFKRDLVGDLMKMFQSLVGVSTLQHAAKTGVTMENFDLSALDSVVLLQITWAMSKADKYGQSFPSFEAWANENEDINVFDMNLLSSIMEETTNGFFRSGAKFIAPNAR